MPLHAIKDHSISYQTAGTGAPLVLIAGLGATHFFWWKQIPALSAIHRLIVPDNRGIGDSTPVSAPFTVADMADDVAALIRGFALAPCHIAGISMGGFIALTLALRHRDLVRKLILCATSAGGEAHVAPAPEILALLVQSDFPDIAARTRAVFSAIAGPGFMAANPADLNALVRNAEEKPPAIETYLNQLGAVDHYVKKAGVDRLLDRITVPTLVIHGDKDPLVVHANGQNLAARIPGARLHTYQGVGHLPPIEATNRFNADVLAFLEP